MSDVSQYIYRIQPTRRDMLATGPTEREQEIISSHFDYLKNLCDLGRLVLAGRTLTTSEQGFGIAILNVNSEESAREIMANDPAVKLGVMRAELFPFRVALLTKVRQAHLG